MGNCSSLARWAVMALLLFGSVLLHELGHSLVARSAGIKVNSITLFFLWQHRFNRRRIENSGQAFQVAIAGPTVSIALFVLLLSRSVYLYPVECHGRGFGENWC